jgi:serine/threonine-protein kinase
MATPHADRNLLFGILALQMDFINRDQLVAGMNAWVLDKLKPLGEILVEQRVLETRDRDIIDAMVGRQVERHGGDVEKSLAALPGAEGLRSRLAPTDDQDVQDSLAAVPGFARFAHASTQDAGTTGGEETASWDGDVFTLTSRLRVLRRHARGGLGEEFLARDEALGRQWPSSRCRTHPPAVLRCGPASCSRPRSPAASTTRSSCRSTAWASTVTTARSTR